MYEETFMQVIRGGKRVDVSIYDIVVGDVVPLNIGDQVSTSALHSLQYISLIFFSIIYGQSKYISRYLLMEF